METHNPYSTPQAHPQAAPQPAANANGMEITPRAVTSLIGMRSWIRVIAFTMGVISIMFCFITIKIVSTGALSRIDNITVYVPFLIGIFAPLTICISMFKFSSKIKTYCDSKSNDDFKSFSFGTGKLFTIMSTVCIVCVIAFIFAIYALYSYQKSVMREMQESRRAQSEQYYR